MGILIAVFLVLFLILLLSAPLIVEAQARLSLRGAVVHARFWLFGLFPIPLRIRLHLFSDPYFTLCIGKKRIRLLRKQSNRKKPRLSGVRILRLDAKTTVGIENEPAQSVLAAGAAAVLLGMLITRFAESGSSRAGLCRHSLFRLRVRMRAIVFPPKLLFEIVRNRCIARRNAVNNTHKTNEKRTNYASC